MTEHNQRHRRARHATLRLVAVLILLLSVLPAAVASGQDTDAEPVDVPAALGDQLAAAPGLTTAPVPEGIELPDGMTVEEVAQMPDRSKVAVVSYEVQGDTINATVQLPASQATFISSGQPNSNFAGLSTLNLGWDQNAYNAMRVLMQFDLSPLPGNAQINEATFYINQSYINPPSDGSSMDFRAQFMQQSWNAGSVTWNNANYLGGDSLPLGSIPPVTGWVSGGATDVVKAWDSGRPNYGLIITGDETPSRGRWRQFYSRSIPQFAPYLLVNYSANCDTAAPVSNMGALNSFEPAEFLVKWSAFDPDQPGCKASGVAWYNVRYRINGSGWTNWKNQSTSTENHFRGWAPNNSTVEFQVQAADRAGNLGAWSPIVSTRVDSEPPVATVNPLPEYTVSPNFTVTWSGTDNLSGIAYYNFQLRKNSGDWQLVLSETKATSYQVTGGQLGDKYEFRVQAVDNVGNTQPWSANAQASTVIFDKPIAAIYDFNPNVIKPTSPVTDVISVNWIALTPPGTTVTEVKIFYRYTAFGGTSSAWTQWQVFTTDTGPADFDYTALGHSNGLYEFSGVATNNTGATQPFDPDNGLGASVILDLDDQLQPQAYMPVVADQRHD